MKESNDGETFVRELLQRAGERPTVPSEDVDGIVESARTVWRDRYGRRSRAWLLPAAAAIVAGIVGLWWAMRPQPDSPAQIASGSTIDRTTVMRLSGGQTLRIAAGSRIHVVTGTLVQLDRGAAYLDSLPGSSTGEVTIRTFAGDVIPIGTQFEVRVDDARVDLRVREGVVALVRQAAKLTAHAGQELIVHRDGTITRTEVSPYDPSWAWAVAVAPMPEIEGRPLRAFLDWIAREKGLKLEFPDDRTVSLSNTVILHGSVAQLTPDQALQTIALSSGFGYRVKDGALIISSP